MTSNANPGDGQSQFMIDSAQFHHLGYATRGIDKAIDTFTPLGYQREGDEFIDHTQGIRGLFMVGGGPRVELLENLPSSDVLTPWINRGVGVYHLAYEVGSLSTTMAKLRLQRARVVMEPVPAVAFGGRNIMFAMLRSGLLLEFIEASPGQ